MSARIPVLFRRWPAREGGDVLALFPSIPETHPGQCSSYARIGQHGAADLGGVLAVTRPADLRAPDVRALRRELESDPYRYRLKVMRNPRNARRTLAVALAAMLDTGDDSARAEAAAALDAAYLAGSAVRS